MSPSARLLVAVAALLVTAAPLAAKTYRWVDEQGNVHYTDHPPPSPPAAPSSPAPAGTPGRGEPSAPPRAAPPSPAAPAPATLPSPATPPRVPVAPAAPEASATRRDDQAALTHELIELSGMDRHLEQLANAGRSMLWTSAWRAGTSQRAWPALAPLLRRDVLVKPAVACLARHMDAGHLPEVLTWLRSPLGEKIRRLEAEMSSPARYDEYRKFVDRLPEGPIPPVQLAAVQAMEKRGRIAEQQVALEHAMRAAITRALELGAEADHEGGNRSAAEEHNRFWVVTASLFAYRKLTEAELETYVAFDMSPAGVWFSSLYWQCLRETVKATEQRATEALRPLAPRAVRPSRRRAARTAGRG